MLYHPAVSHPLPTHTTLRDVTPNVSPRRPSTKDRDHPDTVQARIRAEGAGDASRLATYFRRMRIYVRVAWQPRVSRQAMTFKRRS
jgi:hypothetical protein